MDPVSITFEMSLPSVKEVLAISRMTDKCGLSLDMAPGASGTVSFTVKGGLIRIARFAFLMRKWSKAL